MSNKDYELSERRAASGFESETPDSEVRVSRSRKTAAPLPRQDCARICELGMCHWGLTRASSRVYGMDFPLIHGALRIV